MYARVKQRCGSFITIILPVCRSLTSDVMESDESFI